LISRKNGRLSGALYDDGGGGLREKRQQRWLLNIGRERKWVGRLEVEELFVRRYG